MRILAVDTSTQYAFLVLCVYHAQWNTEKWTCVKIDRDKDNWLELLVNEFCDDVSLKSLDGFASGYGPGSFTGLRINFTYLKTLSILWNKIFLTFSTSRFYHSVFCKPGEVLLVQANRNLYFSCDPDRPDTLDNMRSLAQWASHYLELNLSNANQTGRDGFKNGKGILAITQKKIRLWNQYPQTLNALNAPNVENSLPLEFEEIDPSTAGKFENITVEMPNPDYILKNKKELMNSMPFYGHDVVINRKL